MRNNNNDNDNDNNNNNSDHNYDDKIPKNSNKSCKIPTLSATVIILENLLIWLTEKHEMIFEGILSNTVNVINYNKVMNNKKSSQKYCPENKNSSFSENGNGNGNINDWTRLEIDENSVPKKIQTLSNLFCIKNGTSLNSIDPVSSGILTQTPSNFCGIAVPIVQSVNDRTCPVNVLNLDSCCILNAPGYINSSTSTSSSSSSSNSNLNSNYCQKGGIGMDNKIFNFNKDLDSNGMNSNYNIIPNLSPTFLNDETIPQKASESYLNNYVCPPRSEWGKFSLHIS